MSPNPLLSKTLLFALVVFVSYQEEIEPNYKKKKKNNRATKCSSSSLSLLLSHPINAHAPFPLSSWIGLLPISLLSYSTSSSFFAQRVITTSSVFTAFV